MFTEATRFQMSYKPPPKPCPICNTDQVSHERTLNDTELLKCGSCGLVYANLNDQRIMEFNSGYDEELTAMYEEQQSFIDTMWFRRIVKKLTKKIGRGRVLDVGCGNGILLKHFLDDGWSACGVDLSPWAQKFAQKYGYELYSRELEKCELPDASFDAVTITSTLEHIPRPYQHIKEIMRVLRPGGIAYFAGIPNYGSLSVRLNFTSFHNNMPPYHVNYFTRKCVSDLFSRPEIAACIKKLSITSYGIPEMYRIHNLMRRSSGSTSRESDMEQKPKSLPRRALASAMVAAYYNLGRPFRLGDKLEITAVRR